MRKQTIFGSLAMVAIIALGIVIMGIFASNKEIRLRNAIEAEKVIYESSWDKLFKSINQIAQVPEAAKEAFREMYIPLMEERYSGERGGAIFSWIQENNPTFDWSLYANVQKAIETHRTQFYEDGRRLQAMCAEHNNMLTTWPSKMFVGKRSPIQVKIISSTMAKKAAESGIDDDIDLFPDKTGDE